MRPFALLPLACLIVTFVLGMLCLFAGHKPGFMEDYHLVSLNTSMLDHVLLNVPSATTSEAAPSSTSFGSWLENTAKNFSNEISNKVEEQLNEIVDDLADALAKELGTHQWYSLHLMNMCKGNYLPNATTKHSRKNVTHCTKQTTMYHFDITRQIENELHVGKHNVSLKEIGWPNAIQNGISALDVAMNVTFVLYTIGIIAAGLGIFTAFVAFFLHDVRLVLFGNILLIRLAFFALLISSIVVTVAQKKLTRIINKYGNDIGVTAYRGTKYLTITWVATAVMFLPSLAWMVDFCIGRRIEKRVYTEKSGGLFSRHGEAALRRSSG
ncbi:actin cortical patch SUR7/pH-response regulator pali [Bisporella sp. PMI_857]|nr:actin cortical patch SUR7/pH-response regulator pali [Bisporella sp. PMI_857]